MSGLFAPPRSMTPAERGVYEAILEKANDLAAQIGTLNPAVYGRMTGTTPPADIAGGYSKDPALVTLALRSLEDAVARATQAITT